MAGNANRRRPERSRAEVPDDALRRVPDLEELLARSRDHLLDAAHALGLMRTSRLRKDELARRIREALVARSEREEPPRVAAPGPVPAAGEPPAAPAVELEPQRERAVAAKLDLGAAPQPAEPLQHIPWSYGLDRVTAAAVDPDRLFVYWEVTEPAIERARAALGPGGPGAWLDLRVYDTTGRLFDGTNAHSYFDHRVERGDRQWFFTIGKPTSTALVEIGMMSSEGFFARIARSGRVDFPRKEPAPWREPEWMTVLASGEQRRGDGVPRHPGPRVPDQRHDVGAPQQSFFAQLPPWILREGGEAVMRRLLEEGWERVEWQLASGEGWSELARRFEWSEPAVVTSWEAGPFAYPVAVEGPRREAWEGGTLVYRANGVTHVVYGPWQVVIRNLGAHSARTVLGRWEIYRWQLAASGREVRAARSPGRAAGASERVLGASERLWIAGSELRLGGASEFWRVGASEVRFRGASERRFVGASEVRFRGASERRFVGASERRMRGASEVRLRGASEVRMRGASERRLAGGSELRLGGASERRLGGASERRLGGASEQRIGGASELRLASEQASPLPYPPPDAATSPNVE